MTGFNLDFNDKFEGGVADGKYEVVVNMVKEDATPSGSEFVQVDLIIRNDVQQKFSNAHIFHRIWKSKDTGKYNFKSFNTLGWAFRLQEGKNYKDLNDLLQDFLYKTALVTVKNETSEFNGKTYENLNVKRWEQSKFTNLQHQFKNKEPQVQSVDISDDDLPF